MRRHGAAVREGGSDESVGERIGLETHDVTDFVDDRSPDLTEKCRRFGLWLGDMRARGLYQRQYRVTLEGPLDRRVAVRWGDGSRELTCFDSNSYLGLHLHPRVVEAVRRALSEFGYGTPSAQLLGGTSRPLRELEETISDFFGREDTLITPTGYAANLGAIPALAGRHDQIVCDRFSHASIHDGCRFASATSRRYPHLRYDRLAARLREPCEGGRLVVTDGVFSMHGRIASLPDLRRVADEAGALLYVDDAHGLGVLGTTGRGIEEHFDMPGSVDVLMGTFSKAPGSVGGYVTGSAAVIDYLRIHARSAVFTAALPAAICAGLAESMRVMAAEPGHRHRLWDNTRRLWSGLSDNGLSVPPLETPIVPVFIGHEAMLWRVSSELFDAGFKCGNVTYPAVPKGEGVIRVSVSARHTHEDVDRLVDALTAIGRRHDILWRSREQIVERGSALATAPDGRRAA